MKTRIMAIAVIALALVGSSVGLVHAGSRGVPLDVFVADCYLIAGAKPPHTLDLDDQFGERTDVKLGTAQLLCTQANASVTSDQDLRAGLVTDHLKCYAAPPKGQPPKVEVQVVDPFLSETVTVGVPRFVCVGAVKCPVGQDCPE
jgi:hypothetical protein